MLMLPKVMAGKKSMRHCGATNQTIQTTELDTVIHVYVYAALLYALLSFAKS